MKVSKKTIGVMAGSMSAILIGGGSLVGLSLMYDKTPDGDYEEKPLNRGDNYEHFKISQYIQKNENLSKIVKLYISDDKYHRKIDEKTFLEQIKSIIKDVLNSTSKFKGNIDKYKFDMSYRISPDMNMVLIDVVWYMPNIAAEYYYYDQFQISINEN